MSGGGPTLLLHYLYSPVAAVVVGYVLTGAWSGQLCIVVTVLPSASAASRSWKRHLGYSSLRVAGLGFELTLADAVAVPGLGAAGYLL